MKDEHKTALVASKDALQRIRSQLKPFIKHLDSDDAPERARAQALVALSMGTLRYMNARLEGKDEGRSKDDALRQELDKMKNVLMQLEKKRAKADGSKKDAPKGKPKKKTKSNDAPIEDQKHDRKKSASTEKRKAAAKDDAEAKPPAAKKTRKR